jgi:hypothetical protein
MSRYILIDQGEDKVHEFDFENIMDLQCAVRDKIRREGEEAQKPYCTMETYKKIMAVDVPQGIDY